MRLSKLVADRRLPLPSPSSSPDSAYVAARTAASVIGLMLAVPACGATECIRTVTASPASSALRK